MNSRARYMLLGVLAMLVIGVAGTASASAATQHFYTCKKEAAESAAFYSTLAKCGEGAAADKGFWARAKVAEGGTVKVEGKGTETFSLKSTALTVTVKIDCTTEKAKGTITNPAGGGAGTNEETIEFSSCTVSQPEGGKCKVTEPIKAEATSLLDEFSAKPATEFKAKGTNFTEITFTGCTNAGLNKTYPVKGADQGIANNSKSELEFTTASSSLTFGGEPATLKGKSKVFIEGNEAGSGIAEAP